jgi:hypothetical protein
MIPHKSGLEIIMVAMPMDGLDIRHLKEEAW